MESCFLACKRAPLPHHRLATVATDSFFPSKFDLIVIAILDFIDANVYLFNSVITGTLGASLVNTNNSYYLYGGADSNTKFNELWQYNPPNRLWTKIAFGTSQFHSCRSVHFCDSIVAVCGRSELERGARWSIRPFRLRAQQR